MKISDSEMKIMNLIWDTQGPATTAELLEGLGDSGWKPTTVLTFLSRLEEKGCLTVEKAGRQNCYRPRLSREDYKREETRSFVEQIHGGSYQSLFAALCTPGDMTQQEVEELRRWFLQEEK